MNRSAARSRYNSSRGSASRGDRDTPAILNQPSSSRGLIEPHYKGNKMPRKIITAIYDRVAQDIIGPLQVFPHNAPAIRMFSDVANDKRTPIGQHPADFDLILLGFLDDNNGTPSIDACLDPLNHCVITGQQWMDAQRQEEKQ